MRLAFLSVGIRLPPVPVIITEMLESGVSEEVRNDEMIFILTRVIYLMYIVVECNVTGALRLMDVTSLFDGAQVEGRLEMCYNGLWHTIPGGFYWGTVNARVACSQLGYTRFGRNSCP